MAFALASKNTSTSSALKLHRVAAKSIKGPQTVCGQCLAVSYTATDIPVPARVEECRSVEELAQ